MMTSKSERESAVMHLQEPRVQLSSQLFVFLSLKATTLGRTCVILGPFPVFTVNFLI